MSNNPLRQIVLRGPDWKGTDQPFWVLRASAPDMFMSVAEGDQKGLLWQDHVHPLRTVLGEPADVANLAIDGNFRRPHLVSLHLLAGYGPAHRDEYSTGYSTRFSEMGPEDKFAVRRSYPPGFAEVPRKKRVYSPYPAREALEVCVLTPGKDGTDALKQSVEAKRHWLHRSLVQKKYYITTPSYFITGPVPATGNEKPDSVAPAAFQHVLVEPLGRPGEAWPKPDKPDEGILLPEFGLVAGNVELAVADGAFPWLGNLQPTPKEPSDGTRISRYPLWLTPDGIELKTKVNFPGTQDELAGHFLLAPAGDGSLVLTLLPEKTEQEALAEWLTAWRKAMPGADQEETLHGFRVSCNRDVVPEFRWVLPVEALDKNDFNGPGLRITGDTTKLPVEIPARHVRMELLSPRGASGIDGVVIVGGQGHFLLSRAAFFDSNEAARNRCFGSKVSYDRFSSKLADKNSLVLAWSDAAAAPAIHLSLEARNDGLQASSMDVSLATSKAAPYRCAHDEQRLAAALRFAYGLAPATPGTADLDRPLLYGFVPMSDGWLQLPIPNVPPLDPALDSEMLGVPNGAATNSLNGFLRFRSSSRAPDVLSAFDPELAGPLVDEAPWSITLEHAAGLHVAVALSSADRTPSLGAAVVDEPRLSTRGLVWFSSDRPDAVEAIPRLGAGPGAFIDIPLEREAAQELTRPIVGFDVLALSLHSEDRGTGAALVKRTALKLEIALSLTNTTWKKYWPWTEVRRDELAENQKTVSKDNVRRDELAENQKTVYWNRHPCMPVASQMPMTRSATSAVRPLESRDLVPFRAVHTGSSADSLPLANLQWTSDGVFPILDGSWQYSVVKAWPLPKSVIGEPEDRNNGGAMNVQGLGLLAFGVPGVELAPLPFSTGDAWKLRSALRYDLPVLDEAFATATLPPSPDEDSAAPAIEPLVAEAATALDWAGMASFWGEQNRRLQLSRVAHSYLAEYRDEGALGEEAIGSLVGGFTWHVPRFGFTSGKRGEALPYGLLTLGEHAWSGNEALRGVTATFRPDADNSLNVIGVATKDTIGVLGYSPSSFLLNNYLLDARGSGARPPMALRSGGWWRPVTGHANDPGCVGLLSCGTMIDVRSQGAGNDPIFHFWFKDLPLDSGGKFTGRKPEGTVDTLAWQDGHLQRSGFEWRLVPASDDARFFEAGDDRMPFYGFMVEPLQLKSLSTSLHTNPPEDQVLLDVTVLARLHLGAEFEGVDDGGNLIEFDFVADGQGGLALKTVRLHAQRPLRFPLQIKTHTVTLEASEIGWTGTDFTLPDATLLFEFLGRSVSLPKSTVVCGAEGVTSSWKEKETPLLGTLEIREAVLTVRPIGKNTTFLFKHEVSIAPLARGATARPALRTVGIASSEGWSGEAEDWSDSTLTLLKASTDDVDFHGGPKAFCITVLKRPLSQVLVEGFPTDGSLQFGLLASIGEFKNGKAPLVAGSLSGTVGGFKKDDRDKTDPTPRILLTSVRFEAVCRRRAAPGAKAADNGSDWIGGLTLDGVVKGRSAIGWPEVTSAATPIPFPGAQAHGRTTVALDAKHWYAHDVEWVLDEHAMSFEAASGINGNSAAVWIAPVLARHTLRAYVDSKEDGRPSLLPFTSIDTIAMGQLSALIPPHKEPGDDKLYASTFAARYANNTPGEKKEHFEPGMDGAGRGGLGTVLQGTLGNTFRIDVHASTEHAPAQSGVLVIGGFAGLLQNSADPLPLRPLLRLPTLLALSDGPLRTSPSRPPALTQRAPAPSVFELSWADGLAAATIATTFRSAVAPTTRAEADLDAAIAIGARALAKNVQVQHKISNALLVEQSFPVNMPGPGNLNSTPYFLASAIGLSRSIPVLKRELDSPDREVLALSLLSRADLAKTTAKTFIQRSAAALVTRSGQQELVAVSSPQLQAELLVTGDDLAGTAWWGGEVGNSEFHQGAVATKAYALHAKPRLAMIRDTAGMFHCMDFPQPVPKPRTRTAPDPVFADAGRGYMLDAVADLGVMSGVEEGGSAAMRDETSGIAGLGRVANLPAHALALGGKDPADTEMQDGLVWLAQQRVPVYLPLVNAIEAEPIPWLVPGAPRTRLPVRNEVRKALLRAAGTACWQPFLAEQAMWASLSDRPGILMARRLRLEGSGSGATRPDAFDEDFPRFGRAGQASSSLARTERTPRPGPLPVNTDDALRNRRPCASPLLPLENSRPLIGPADTVRGIDPWRDGTGVVAWSVTLVASPRTSGMVTPSWDGTLELIAEIDEKLVEEAIDANGERAFLDRPALFNHGRYWIAQLVALLLGKDVNSNQLKASACLMVNGRPIPFRQLHVLEVGGALHTPFRRGYVKLVLDARDKANASNRVPGPALPAISELLSGVQELPTIELQFRVHPGMRATESTTTAAAPGLPYDLAIDQEDQLPRGDRRAPVTLRMPLWPILPSRGALPLEPSTLVFIDPAYDAGLAVPPFEDVQRVVLDAPPKPESNPATPGRGDLNLVLSSDRRRVNRRGVVTLMVDLRFEAKLDRRLRERLDDKVDGDLSSADPDQLFELKLRLQPKAGTERTLRVGTGSRSLLLSKVHELALSSLVEQDGTPALLCAGDVLEVVIAAPEQTPIKVLVGLDASGGPVWGQIENLGKPGSTASRVTRTLRLVLTDEPVVEPPPGLYAAMLKIGAAEPVLSLPLYAQSPLPWRVDLVEAKEDFRAGLLRRSATFVWTLARPRTETTDLKVYVVKSDRNGQTYLPESEQEFLSPTRLPSLWMKFEVEPVASSIPNGNWATAAAVLLSWAEGGSLNAAQAAERGGAKFVEKLEQDRPLTGKEVGEFASLSDFSVEQLQTCSPTTLYSLMQAYGPLWAGSALTLDAPYSGCQVIAGIESDGAEANTWLTVIESGEKKRVKLADSKIDTRGLLHLIRLKASDL